MGKLLDSIIHVTPMRAFEMGFASMGYLFAYSKDEFGKWAKDAKPCAIRESDLERALWALENWQDEESNPKHAEH